MARVLVLGTAGMLGHKAVQRLGNSFEVAGTVRGAHVESWLREAIGDARVYTGVSAEDLGSIERVLDEFRPDVVLNCIGIIKQLKEAKDPIPSISINALLPHQLARLTQARDARLIHFSTDCVFAGTRGGYTEDDQPDAYDLYGRTKLLGEVTGPNCLTIRSSIIGHELRNGLSLVDWFLSQRGGEVQGFTRAIYSGLSTPVMADLVGWLIKNHPDLGGLWQVASEPISKYELLKLIKRVYDLPITVHPQDQFCCDRSLDGTRFRQKTGWVAPSWPDMIAAMHQDYRPVALVA
jgi:dTDP-4-dehydrorhamnose reductase